MLTVSLAFWGVMGAAAIIGRVRYAQRQRAIVACMQRHPAGSGRA